MVLNSKDSTFTKLLNETLSRSLLATTGADTMTTTIFQQPSTMSETKETMNFSKELGQVTTILN